MPPEQTSAADNFPTPYLREHRFSEAVDAGYRVFPHWQGMDEYLIKRLREIFDHVGEAEAIAFLDDLNVEVGFPAGAVNAVTVLEVRTAEAQECLEALDLSETPCFWSPRGRYYLFQHLASSELLPSERLVPGLRFLNDGDCVLFPGSMVDGQLVHWELEPDWASPMPLPDELRSNTARDRRAN